MEGQEAYSVILAKPEGVDRKILIQVFREYSRINPNVSEISAKNSAGFIAEKINKEEVLALGKICSNLDVGIFIVSDAQVAALPEPTVCKSIKCLPEDFQYSVDGASFSSVPWDQIAIVCAGSIEEEKINTSTKKEGPSALKKASSLALTAMTGIPISAGKTREVIKKIKQTFFNNYLELIIQTEIHVRLKMNQESLDYSYLGHRREYSSLLNFRTALEDINIFVANGLKNQVFLSILKREATSLHRYEDYRFFEKELRWLLTIHQLKNKRS